MRDETFTYFFYTLLQSGFLNFYQPIGGAEFMPEQLHLQGREKTSNIMFISYPPTDVQQN